MSKRVLLCTLLALCAGNAVAESGATGNAAADRIVRLGDSNWLLYRPTPAPARIYDLDFMMERLRCNQSALGLRFSRSAQFRLDLTLAPLTDRRDFVGPVYDMDIGATRLVVSFGF